MRGTACLLLMAAVVGGCDTSPMVRGVTDDGEIFTGVATANGMWDTSGSLQLVSNRGANCIGKFVFEGMVGPRGKATFFCSNGQSGEASLQMTGGVDKGTGEGTIGGRPIRFTFGRQPS